MRLSRLILPMLVLLLAVSGIACSEKDAPKRENVQKVGNKTCPLSGRPVAGTPDVPTVYSDLRGYRLGFADEEQKKRFDGLSTNSRLSFLNRALKERRMPPLKSAGTAKSETIKRGLEWKDLPPEEACKTIDVRQREDDKEAVVEIDLWLDPEAGETSQRKALFWAFKEVQKDLKPWKKHKHYTLLVVRGWPFEEFDPASKPMHELRLSGPWATPKVTFHRGEQLNAVRKLKKIRAREKSPDPQPGEQAPPANTNP